jgi:hypothetical protein
LTLKLRAAAEHGNGKRPGGEGVKPSGLWVGEAERTLRSTLDSSNHTTEPASAHTAFCSPEYHFEGFRVRHFLGGVWQPHPIVRTADSRWNRPGAAVSGTVRAVRNTSLQPNAKGQRLMTELKFERVDEPRSSPEPCINPECDKTGPAGAGVSVSVTYPSGAIDYACLCSDCARKLKV